MMILDIIPALCRSLKIGIDFSKATSSKLLPQLITALKSTNVAVRDASQSSARELLARCNDSVRLGSMAEVLIRTIKDGIHG